MQTEFFKPIDMKSTLGLLKQYQEGAVIVNGGSDIVEKINKGGVTPAAIIYIADIQELKQISRREGKIVIGGAVTYAEMLKSPIVQQVLGLVEAVRQLGSPPIREVATAAGNLGTAAPSADCTTMLMSLDTKIVLVSEGKERIVDIDKFFVKSYKNVIEPDELIKEIYFDEPNAEMGSGYIRLARRKSQDIGKVLVGASLTVREGICKNAIIGLGALNATAVRAVSIEAAITGKNKDEALAYIQSNFPKEAGLRESRFKSYKERVTCVAIERAVTMAWNNTGEVQ